MLQCHILSYNPSAEQAKSTIIKVMKANVELDLSPTYWYSSVLFFAGGFLWPPLVSSSSPLIWLSAGKDGRSPTLSTWCFSIPLQVRSYFFIIANQLFKWKAFGLFAITFNTLDLIGMIIFFRWSVFPLNLLIGYIGCQLNFIWSSAGQRLITINRIQNKRFCGHNICVCTVYVYYV